MKTLRTFGFFWGIFGVLAFLLNPIVRLTPLAVDAFHLPLSPLHLVFCALWLPFMLYSEGHRGFHRGFSPRVVSRARKLRDAPDTQLHHILLAPAYCMSLFHAPRRRMIAMWCVLFGIVALVLIVGRLSQPWRGLVDAGVVLGLSYGTLSILYHLFTPPPEMVPPMPSEHV